MKEVMVKSKASKIEFFKAEHLTVIMGVLLFEKIFGGLTENICNQKI